MSNAKKTVLMGIPVLYQGGTEEQMLSMAICLQDKYNIYVLVYFDSQAEMKQRFLELNIQIIEMNLSKKSGFKNTFNALCNRLKEIQPDYFHVQYIAPGLLPILAAKKTHIKRIFSTVHQPGTPYPFKQKLMINFAALLTHKFLCVSRSVKNSWFYKMHPNRRSIKVLPNAIDLKYIEKCTQNCESSFGNEYIMYAGRLRQEKGCDILIEAFSLISKQSNIHLLIVGEGPDEILLKKRAETLGCLNKIKWINHLKKPELFVAMHHAKLGIIPSRFEGFGLVALEFIACGTPVIASDLPAFHEFISNDKNGTFFKVNDAHELAHKVLVCIKESPFDGREDICRSVQNFGLEAYKKLLDEIYGEKND